MYTQRRLMNLAVLGVVVLVLGLMVPEMVQAQGIIETPAPISVQSGVALIRGWVCAATVVELELDGGPGRVSAVYKLSREDTRPDCGDADNGFAFLINWNSVGDGPHTLRVFADGEQFATAEFTVTTLGLGEFPQGLESLPSALATLPNFPMAGTDVQVRWQESRQNFGLQGVIPPGRSENICTTQSGQLLAGGGQVGDFSVNNICSLTVDTLEFDISFPTQEAQGAVQMSAQTVGEQFLACVELLGFLQGGQQFTSRDFRWLDGQGNDICRELAPGERVQGIIAVNPGVQLNFGEPFQMLYNQITIATFDSAPSPVLTVSQTSLDFGTVVVGDSNQQRFTVTNTGGGTLLGGAATMAPFAVVAGETFNLGAGQSQLIVVQFSPTSSGSFTGSVNLTSNGGTASVSIAGIGTSPADLQVRSINTVDVNCSGAPVSCVTTVSFTIENSGEDNAGAFKIRTVFDPAQSLVVNQSINGLAAGATQTLRVQSPAGGNCFDPDCTVCVTVDSDDTAVESDETNNLLCETSVG